MTVKKAKFVAGWRVVYGETRPAWEQIFPTKRKAEAFRKRCLGRGDTVFSVAKTVAGEPPQSIMAAIEEAETVTPDIDTLTHVVQRHETGPGGGKWWHTMAAFDCKKAAIAYLERIRPLVADHRILPVKKKAAA